MRRRSVVAIAALIVAFALVGLPIPAGSRTPSANRDLQPAAFTSVIIPADALAQRASGPGDRVLRSASRLTGTETLVEPGDAPAAPSKRPKVTQPAAKRGEDWKAPRSKVSGYATFYDNGATAMRLPRGTVVRICGAGGCIQRTVTDYGPQKKSRVVDMYRPDFFRVCGCQSWSGTTWVTVSIY